MSLFASVLKTLTTASPSKLFLNSNAAVCGIISRPHSHSTLSVKRVIPPKPQQVKEKYDIDFNPPGALQGWTDWHMKRDHRRRGIIVKHGAERMLVNTIRRNDILPREIREIADKEIVQLPRDSGYRRVVKRCCVSSRPRGVVINWRLSRHFFRHLADYNKLSGVQRGIW